MYPVVHYILIHEVFSFSLLVTVDVPGGPHIAELDVATLHRLARGHQTPPHVRPQQRRMSRRSDRLVGCAEISVPLIECCAIDRVL